MQKRMKDEKMFKMKLLLILGFALLMSCSSITVKTDFDPSADFSKYKTYSWYTGKMPDDDALAKNPLIKKRVIASVDKVLAGKGFKKVDDGNPDFVVIVHGATKQKTQISSYGYGAYGYGRWGYGWGGYGPSGIDVYQYDEATIFIDIADFAKKELVWRGTGTDVVSGTDDPEELQENIDNAVSKILEDFPPNRM
jgi:hypothetical protein